MDELKLETPGGQLPIDRNIAKKYELRQGTRSPFTGKRILGKNGSFQKPPHRMQKNTDLRHPPETGVMETEDGLLMTTSEIIDFASGADSGE